MKKSAIHIANYGNKKPLIQYHLYRKGGGETSMKIIGIEEKTGVYEGTPYHTLCSIVLNRLILTKALELKSKV